MGYRSEWKIALVGTTEQIQGIVGWFEQAMNATTRPEDERLELKEIFETRRFTKDNCGVVFGETERKISNEFEVVRQELFVMIECEDRFKGVYGSYGRLGDDMEDFEFTNVGDSALVQYERKLVCELDDELQA